MTVEDTLLIQAAIDDVWRVTVDVERWPEWAPTVTDVRRLENAPFGLGSRVRIKQPGQPETVWTVTEFAVGERFTWDAARRGLHMRATHELTPAGDGTRNTLRVEVTGLLAPLFAPILRPLLRRALADENRGLQTRCEAAR